LQIVAISTSPHLLVFKWTQTKQEFLELQKSHRFLVILVFCNPSTMSEPLFNKDILDFKFIPKNSVISVYMCTFHFSIYFVLLLILTFFLIFLSRINGQSVLFYTCRILRWKEKSHINSFSSRGNSNESRFEWGIYLFGKNRNI